MLYIVPLIQTVIWAQRVNENPRIADWCYGDPPFFSLCSRKFPICVKVILISSTFSFNAELNRNNRNSLIIGRCWEADRMRQMNVSI